MESKLSLSPIGSKEKAKSIIDKFNQLDYFFVSLRCKGIFKLRPSLLRKIFPDFEFSWSNIFVNGYGKTGLSGIVIIDKDKLQRMSQLLELTGGVFSNSKISVRYKIIEYNVFRSAVLNCNVTSSYRIQTKLSPDTKPIKCQSQNLFLSQDIFIPITLETISYALKLLDKLITRKRAIYVVYHPMFRDSQVSMSFVREVLEPVFEEIETDSVFVKSSLTMLEPTLKEAYSKNFTLCGLAYIISSENLCKNSLAARANEHRLIYGTMTLSCLLTSINKGNYLMSREALLSLGAPVRSVTDC